MRTLLLVLLLACPALAQSSAVKIVTPANGYVCPAGKPVDLTVWVKPGLGVTLVTLVGQDGEGLGMARHEPYTFRWETAGARPGVHKIKAEVHLDDGRTLTSAPITIGIEAPRGAVLKEGTPVLLSNEERMVSGEIPQGAVVKYRVERDVLGPDGEVLIAKGSSALGRVVKSEGSGFFGASGALDIQLETATAVDNTTVPLRALRAATADDQETTVIVGAILVSWAFVFMEGDDVEIAPGTLVNAFVAKDTLIGRPGAAVARGFRGAVNVTSPAAGQRLRREDKIVLGAQATPADDGAFVRFYVDDSLVAWQKGAIGRVEWHTTRNEKQSDRVLSPGEHSITAEVTYSNGMIVTSEPVKFTVED